MPELTNLLAWWQWVILAAVPPAIVALYFLKLRRRPLEVPSTYLWHKSMEDLHVNTIWQRLRRNLLLLLQLLLLLLAIAALLRPHWRALHLTAIASSCWWTIRPPCRRPTCSPRGWRRPSAAPAR